MVAIVSAKHLPRPYLAGFWGRLRLSKTAPGIQIGLQKCCALELPCVNAFLMFFQLVLGPSKGTFELFGTLWDLCCKPLGPPSGISGCFLDLLEPRWASLGLPLGLSWLFWSLFWRFLGCSWASLCGPLGPRCGEAATRCPKMDPKVAPEAQNGPLKSNLFVHFLGSIFGPFSALLVGGFLGRLAP